MTRPMTDIEIAVRIVPSHVGWPKDDSGVWRLLRSCVDSLHNVARDVDRRCAEIERGDRGDIARSRTELGSEIIAKLASFRPFEIAYKAATDKINSLERQLYRTPEEVRTYETLIKARADLSEGIAASKRAVLDRCKMRDDRAYSA
jgi:hypothetical protein